MRSSDLLPSSPFFTTTRFVSANFKLFVSSHTRSIHRATIHAVTYMQLRRQKKNLITVAAVNRTNYQASVSTYSTGVSLCD